MTDTETTLAERLEEARERSGELAANASTKAREFIHDHPVASVAGGIVLGALLAGVLARPMRRSASADVGRAEAVGNAAAERIARMAAIGAELALAYATSAASAGKTGVGHIEDRIVEQFGHLGENGAEATRKLGNLAEVALGALREAGETAIQRLKRRD